MALAGVPLTSNITQANNQEFWLVDSNAIYGGLYHVSTEAERDTLPAQRLKVGMLCYVSDLDTYYKYTADGTWEVFTAGGASSSDIIDQEEIDTIKTMFNIETEDETEN